MSLYSRILVALMAFSASACDTSSSANGACEPMASVSPTYPQNASVAALDANGCRVEQSGALFGPFSFTFGPDRGFEVVPLQQIEIYGPVNDGAQVVLAVKGKERIQPGRYPLFDLRRADGRFGSTPARFSPDSVYSFTSNGDGQGYWFATGGEVVVEQSNEAGMTGTFEATYIHGGGGRPLTLNGRFRAVAGQPGYSQGTNPHGG